MTLSDDLPREYHERVLEEWRSASSIEVTAPRHLYGQAVVLNDIADERARQLRKWGPQSHPDGTDPKYADLANLHRSACDAEARTPAGSSWRSILREETYESFAETDRAALRKELVQAAAVAVAWIEDLDKRG